MNLKPGSQLQGGRYRIESVLGQGGFGITYLGVQTSLDDKVAIKEFFMRELCNRDPETMGVSVGSVGSRELVNNFRKKFIKEARNIRKLKHRNIVPIIDVFEENGTAYYVMEYLEGGNFSSIVSNGGPLDEPAALSCIRQLAAALEEVHANGMLHLDIKPTNVMLDKRGQAVLIDFGVSKHYDESGSQTSSGLTGISEGYAPLEQYDASSLKTFTPATDVYALGATLFFILTGKRPPKASEVMNMGLPALPARVSRKVKEAVVAAMQPGVAMRPQNIKEFLALLDGEKPDTSRPDDTGKTEYVNEGVTAVQTPIVDIPVVEVLHRKAKHGQPEVTVKQQIPPAHDKEEKVKWMDFEEFKDKSYPAKFEKFVEVFFRVAACMTLISFCGLAVSGFDWDFGYSLFMCILCFLLLPSLVLVVIFKSCYRIKISNINDIQATASPYKLIRDKDGLFGLSLWKKRCSRLLLKMKYDKISRINDETFICTLKGKHGVYNAVGRKMIVPVECESIKLKDGKIHAVCGGVLTIYNDKGYRVVEMMQI